MAVRRPSVPAVAKTTTPVSSSRSEPASQSAVSPDVAHPTLVQAPPELVNVAAPEFGGHIALVTSEADHEDRAAIHLIDRGKPEQSTWSAAGPSPQEVVVGFLPGHTAQISAIIFNPNTHIAARWAKDVEAWVSTESATAGFEKVGSLTLTRDDVEQTMTFPPVAARFLKIRVLSQYLGDDYAVGLGKIKVMGVLDAGGRRRRRRCRCKRRRRLERPSCQPAPPAKRSRLRLRATCHGAAAAKCSCSRARTTCIPRCSMRPSPRRRGLTRYSATWPSRASRLARQRRAPGCGARLRHGGPLAGLRHRDQLARRIQARACSPGSGTGTS